MNKQIQTVLVKISGDLLFRNDVLLWLSDLVRVEKYYTVVCIGGGSQINQAFETSQFPIQFGPLGREITDHRAQDLAQEVLESNRTEFERLLLEHKISATVVTPNLQIGSVHCPVNGDVFVLTAYLGFSKIFVLTLEDRVGIKSEKFKIYPKIKVVGFKKRN